MKSLLERLKGNGETFTFAEIIAELEKAYRCIYLNVDPMEMPSDHEEVYNNACEYIEKP